MMAPGLTLSEEFILLFNNLKEAAGNSPERVSVFYKDSRAIRDALHALLDFLVRTDLERRVFHGRKLLTVRAAGFETAWKEYDQEWRFRVIWPKVDYLEIDPDGGPDPSSAQQGPWKGEEIEPEPPAIDGEPDNPDPEVEESFDPRRHDGAVALELGLQQLEFYGRNAFSKSDENSCRIALGAFDYLTDSIGLDIQGVFRRLRKLPVIFIPTHVSNRCGASEKGSLSHLLDDAVRAYVFGAPAAAIAMCRAAYETVRKEHYRRGELENVLVHASREYDFVSKDNIKFLVDSANRVMHNYSNTQRLTKEDDRIIVNFLATVKFLIQRAPER
jgi:hypothetical protein